MSPILLVFLVAVVAVGIFVLGMSITLMVKGHHIDSEIGTNKNMQEKGIQCAAQQIRNEEAMLRGECQVDELCNSSCSTCGVGSCEQLSGSKSEKGVQ